MNPELMGRIFALRALAQAFLNEFDRLESLIASMAPKSPVEAAIDRLNAEVRHQTAAEMNQVGEPAPFSTEVAEPTPEQLERVRRRQKEQQQPKATAEMTPQQKANLKLVKDYIQANSDGGEHAG